MHHQGERVMGLETVQINKVGQLQLGATMTKVVNEVLMKGKLER